MVFTNWTNSPSASSLGYCVCLSMIMSVYACVSVTCVCVRAHMQLV